MTHRSLRDRCRCNDPRKSRDEFRSNEIEWNTFFRCVNRARAVRTSSANHSEALSSKSTHSSQSVICLLRLLNTERHSPRKHENGHRRPELTRVQVSTRAGRTLRSAIDVAFTLQFQVELALRAKPDDPELHKLKQDLEVRTFINTHRSNARLSFQEVIQITAELLGCDPSILNSDEAAASSSTSYSEAASSSYASTAQASSATASSSARTAIKWKTGDRCLAPWHEDGKYVCTSFTA